MGAKNNKPIVSKRMIRAGVCALHAWIGDDERFSGWDGFAVRDAFLRMHELYLEDQKKPDRIIGETDG